MYFPTCYMPSCLWLWINLPCCSFISSSLVIITVLWQLVLRHNHHILNTLIGIIKPDNIVEGVSALCAHYIYIYIYNNVMLHLWRNKCKVYPVSNTYLWVYITLGVPTSLQCVWLPLILIHARVGGLTDWMMSCKLVCELASLASVRVCVCLSWEHLQLIPFIGVNRCPIVHISVETTSIGWVALFTSIHLTGRCLSADSICVA